MKWLYGYWFKAKKKSFGWGWTIVPTNLPGYVTWSIGAVCCILVTFPEIVSSESAREVMFVAGAFFVVVSLMTFMKTNFGDDLS